MRQVCQPAPRYARTSRGRRDAGRTRRPCGGRVLTVVSPGLQWAGAHRRQTRRGQFSWRQEPVARQVSPLCGTASRTWPRRPAAPSRSCAARPPPSTTRLAAPTSTRSRASGTATSATAARSSPRSPRRRCGRSPGTRPSRCSPTGRRGAGERVAGLVPMPGRQGVLHPRRRLRRHRHGGEAQPGLLARGRPAGQADHHRTHARLPWHERVRHVARRHPGQQRPVRPDGDADRARRRGTTPARWPSRSSRPARTGWPRSSASRSSGRAACTSRQTAT